MDDQELNRLLREWKAPDAPGHLRPRGRRSWLEWLVTGSIRVPVPAAFAAIVFLATWAAWPWPAPSPAQQTPTSQSSIPPSTTPRRSGEVARYPLTGSLAGFDAVLVELNFGPGGSAAEHRHPGFVVGYVVEGQLRTAINREADQIVPAGGTFYEPDGVLHSAFGSASLEAPARVVAFMVVPNGSGLTVR